MHNNQGNSQAIVFAHIEDFFFVCLFTPSHKWSVYEKAPSLKYTEMSTTQSSKSPLWIQFQTTENIMTPSTIKCLKGPKIIWSVHLTASIRIHMNTAVIKRPTWHHTDPTEALGSVTPPDYRASQGTHTILLQLSAPSQCEKHHFSLSWKSYSVWGLSPSVELCMEPHVTNLLSSWSALNAAGAGEEVYLICTTEEDVCACALRMIL